MQVPWVHRLLLVLHQRLLKNSTPTTGSYKKAIVWEWTEQQHKAFEELKTRMCSHPVLTQPNFKKLFFLQTDASAYGMGTILLQEGEHHAVASQKPKLQLLKKLSQCFAILGRLMCRESNKLHNNMKII